MERGLGYTSPAKASPGTSSDDNGKDGLAGEKEEAVGPPQASAFDDEHLKDDARRPGRMFDPLRGLPLVGKFMGNGKS